MKKIFYIDLMERALDAYSDDRIASYIKSVKENGLKEHGFPRLTANIGILISKNRRLDLLPVFHEMMDLCCEMIPKVLAANDFSVREIVLCILALEGSGHVETATLEKWKRDIASIVPEKCYSIYAKTPTDPVRNWALFSGVSEFSRSLITDTASLEFVETQLASQLQWIDENGMYCDNAFSDIHQPMVYDVVPRGLFAIILLLGYNGRYKSKIDSIIKRAALLTLKMQSVTGEIAYGGRSNQFYHNEAWLALIFEYEAARYKKEGEEDLSRRFKSAAGLAARAIAQGLQEHPIHHVKNRFPITSEYGCESYAYFDKYMITVASFLYSAWCAADDSIEPFDTPDDGSADIFVTSEHFHKIFMRKGDYFIEFDTNADPHYDANGIGRFHRRGAVSNVCISCPAPETPSFKTDVSCPFPLALSSTLKRDGKTIYASLYPVRYTVLEKKTDEACAHLALECRYDSDTVIETYTLTDNGLDISVSSKKRHGLLLPAFRFDGECESTISLDSNTLSVSYKGWRCTYESSEPIEFVSGDARNRNGHLDAYHTESDNTLSLHVEITKE